MIDTKNLATMVNTELYNAFVDKYLCIDCPNNKKIIRNNGIIKKVVSCSRFRNKPKSYISRFQDWDNLKFSNTVG